VAVAVLVLLLVAACVDAPPSATPAATGAPPIATFTPPEELPLPDEDATLEQVLLRNTDGRFDRYGSIGQLQGASSICTAVLLDAGAGDNAPAYALTNGHCVGVSGANETLVDAPAEGIAVAFNWFVDVAEHRVVPVTRIAWATMRDTDLALLELGATVGDLGALGLRGWHPENIPSVGGSRDVVMVGIPVGLPPVDIAEAERYLRLGICSLDTEPVRVNERQWLWTGALRNDCPQVLPGNSGSAVLDAGTGRLVGLVNTTTYLGENGAECWLGRPCESGEDGEVTLPDTSYAQPVGGIERCFVADGAFALGGECPLQPGGGATIDGAPLAVNPTLEPVLPDLPSSQATWATTIGGEGVTHYRWKTGPLGTLDCAADEGYSAPQPVATTIDDALPTTEQRLLLCVVGGPSATPDTGWQAPANASIAVTYIDTTPPLAPVRFHVIGDEASGWRIEPVFNPPDLSDYFIKGGPARTTDCGDTDGYRPYRRIPADVAAGDAPYRFCAIGTDDAGNAAPPASKVLK